MQLPPQTESLWGVWSRIRSNWVGVVLVIAIGLLLISSGQTVKAPFGPFGDGEQTEGLETGQPTPTIEPTSTPQIEETPAPSPPMRGLLKWTAPVNGATVSGVVTLEVAAPDQVERVDFSVVGAATVTESSRSDPLAVSIDTATLSDGFYQIEALAYDESGTAIDIAHIGIFVNNVAATPAITRDVAGMDWYLPPGRMPAERSGIYGYGDLNDIMTIQAPMFDWATLHTGDGEYNWEPLDEALALGPVVLRLKCGTPDHVPQFIRNRNNHWQTFVNADGERELPQWQPGWLEEWQPFIAALGERYRNHPDFMGLQLQITESGEPFMISDNAAGFERLGMTPDVLGSFLYQYHSSALDAFAGNEWKVFSVVRPNFMSSYQGSYSMEQYSRAVRNATLPMFERGMGIRGSGNSEEYEATNPWDEWLTFRNGTVMTHDDTFAPIRSEGHVDGQVENWYGGNKSDRVTTNDEDKIRHGIRMSMLRALVDRYSYLWLDSDDLELVGRDFGRYVQLNLGHLPETAPDAFVVFGEYGELLALPRWLWPANLQHTARGVFMNTEDLGYVGDANYLGRTITQELELEVDNRFLDTTMSHDVEVAVTFLDNGSAWHLEYESDGTTVRSPIIAGKQSNEWRTVTMRLPQVTLSGQSSGASDFSLVADSPPVTVFMVRVIR